MWLASVQGGQGSKPRTLSFEVQSFRTDRWVTEVICTSEEEARAEVARMTTAHEGLRIIREFNSPTAGLIETVLFSEMRPSVRGSIQVQPVDHAPVCKQTQDYLGPDSRRTITRLLRQYLEKRSLTASELLYNPSEIRRVMNFENLVPTAVSRAAALQARTLDQEVRTRRDAIFDALGQLRAKAEAAARCELPTARKSGFIIAMAQVDEVARGDAEEQDYLAKFVLCSDLAQIQNLVGKIEWLISLAAEGKASSWQLEVLDALVSDAVATSTVVQDLLGRQPDLGTALIRLLDIVEGRFQPTDREMAPDVTAALSNWVGSGCAPQTYGVLMDSVLRSVAGTQPLSRGDGQAQRVAYAALLERIMGPAGLVGGPAMAEALTTGYLRFIEQGGGEGRRLSIDGVLALLTTGADRLRYLVALSCTPAGRLEMPTILDRVKALLAIPGGVNGLVPPGTLLKPKMQMMAQLYTAMEGSGIPEDERAALADRIDILVADYIVAGRIIEKLDEPSAHLRIRATRLMQFASNDVLASPMARRMVRNQIIHHLRQPDFDVKFIEGLDEQERMAALRTFYELLRQAHFM